MKEALFVQRVRKAFDLSYNMHGNAYSTKGFPDVIGFLENHCFFLELKVAENVRIRRDKEGSDYLKSKDIRLTLQQARCIWDIQISCMTLTAGILILNIKGAVNKQILFGQFNTKGGGCIYTVLNALYR